MAGALSFKDHVEVMDELRTKYQRSDDDKKALAAEQLQDDIAKAAQAREQEVQDAIRGDAITTQRLSSRTSALLKCID